MSGPPERSYSFNYHDESALQPRGQGYQQHQQPEQQYAQPYRDEPAVSPIDPPSHQQNEFVYDPPPPPPAHRSTPSGIHHSSAYAQMQTERGDGAQPESVPRTNTISRRPLSQSPPHFAGGVTPNTSQPRRQSDTTPGMDNLGGRAAGGGISGIAMGVANTNERDSGVQALRDIDNLYRGDGLPQSKTPAERHFDHDNNDQYGYYGQPPRQPLENQPSYGSTAPLAAAAGGYAVHTPPAAARAENSSDRSIPLHDRPPPGVYPYGDSPYDQYSSSNLRLAPAMGAIDPNSIADDDDDSAQSGHQPKRRSFIPFVNNNSSSRQDIAPAATGVGAAAAAGGAFAFGTRDPSGNYATVPSNGARDYAADNGVYTGPAGEKSEWLKSQKSGSKRLRWIVGIIIALVIIGAIVGGVLGAVLSRKNNKSSSDGGNDSTPETVANDNKSDLDNNSAEIKKLFNNADLHKVFPGMDYTPLNMQYPECLSVPPSQNNVTRDMAVLSQLTNVVRLYGTDCNVTEMVLHSIDRLKLTDMKVWLGVWLDSNQTTNDRQLAQFWNTIEKHKDHATDLFKGVIVGNEVLFRKDLTITELAKTLADVKKNLTDMNIDLPVATSDLGDNWTAALVVDVDVVMSNIHPFFAGATAEAAAGWTWSFWQNKDVVLTKGTTTQQVISEVGWPSAGGNNCSPNECTTKTEGSIAGIDEMNTFMEHWVCQSLANSTEYFWFEAFDEPWKVRFNGDGKEWEDKWGLMDVDRNLKPGVKIPDCGGKTVA